EQLLLLATPPGFRLVARRSAPERPVLRELLQRRSETREVEVHAADARLLELGDARAHGLGDLRLNVLPVLDRRIHGRDRPWAADQEDRAVGRGLLPDVQAPLG